MSEDAALIAQLKSADYLGLREISQTYDGPLRIVLEEHRERQHVERITSLDLLALPIEHPDDGKVFELLWEDYVSVSVTGDEYPPYDDAYSGIKSGYFQESLPSDFLTYIQREKSQVFDIHDRALKNWRLVTLTRYVEVVSYAPLQISML